MTSKVYFCAMLFLCGISMSSAESPNLRMRQTESDLADFVHDLRPSIAPVDDVHDPVLAYLVALLEADLIDTMGGMEIQRNAGGGTRQSLIPVDRLISMGRSVGDSGLSRVVHGSFEQKSRIPSPYSILGYHPGALVLSKDIVLAEWSVGDLRIRERKRRKNLDINDCVLWAIIDGSIVMDIDGFIDKLFGGRIDDTGITTLAFFRFNDTPYATAMGYNDDGKGRTGVLDLSTNDFLFPPGWEFKAIGRHLRSKSELYLERGGRSSAPIDSP